MPIIVCMLRQPWMNKPTESRSDPFWEFGSFGTTGCHQRNLMHPGKAASLRGTRFAFVQGGPKGSRLVYLTPELVPQVYTDRTEVRWNSPTMPFKYEYAPVLIDSSGGSDVPALLAMIADVKRHSWMGKFASRFRTRREPLPDDVAKQVESVYRRTLRKAASHPKMLAERYEDALPVHPPRIDRNRAATYEGLREKLTPRLVA